MPNAYDYMLPIIPKIDEGTRLTHAESDYAIAFYSDLEAKLLVMGPHFHLAHVVVLRRRNELEGYRTARDAQL